MPAVFSFLALRGTALLAASLTVGSGMAVARQPAEFAGIWQLSLPKVHASCRITLQAQRSDRGDFFLGMPASCRNAMPGVERVGRWTMPDDTHVTLDDPAGTTIVAFVAIDHGFRATMPEGTYDLAQISAEKLLRPGQPGLIDSSVDSPGVRPFVQAIASRPPGKETTAPREKPSDLAGRYAVLRAKRDTGCMVTLDDRTRAKGASGDRAHLAPGCRDQGIVIFDPTGWQIVRGELVLTARAGHKTHLQKEADGIWQKDAKDGGKPLGLKKL